MKKIISLLLTLAMVTVFASAAYNDIYDGSVSAAADALSGLEIVNGYPDGGFHPDSTLTRAEFCKLAVVTMGYEDEAAAYADRMLFSDVKSGHWALGYVNLAYSSGVVNGYGNGKFGPEDTLTYAQVAAVLMRMLGYTKAQIGSKWPDDTVAYASKLGLDGGLGLSANQPVTRGQTALLMVQMLKTDASTGNKYYTSIAAKSMTDAVLLDNNATSDDGKVGQAKFYVAGQTITKTAQPTASAVSNEAVSQVIYCGQASPLSDDFVGRKGIVLLNGDGDVAAFLPGDEKYTMKEGTLLSADDTSDEGDAHCVKMYLSSGVQWFTQSGTVSGAAVGETGALLINENGYACQFVSYGTTKQDASDGILLLDNDSRSDSGDKHCAKFDIGGEVVWYKQRTVLDSNLVGCTGTLLTDSDGYVTSFDPDGDRFQLIDGILLDNDYNNNGTRHTARFFGGRSIKCYEQEIRLASSYTGCTGTIILNYNDMVAGFVVDESEEKYEVVTDLFYLESNEQADDGRTKQVAVWDGSRIQYYAHLSSFGYDGHERGTALVDEDGKFAMFIEDGCGGERVTVNKSDANHITDTIRIPDSTPVVYHDDSGKLAAGLWSAVSQKAVDGDTAYVYYDETGDAALVYLMES